MCGIAAYIGLENAPKIVIDCLKKLEYRGYDSWGIASLKKDSVLIKKNVGMISEFQEEKKLKESNVSIGHIRWATHGKANKINAHPHFSCDKKIALVHNGIIENFLELKEELLKKKHEFLSETDTEVIAHLIEEELKKNNLKNASINALKKLKGSFAIAFLVANNELLIAARKDAPLIIGLDKKGFLVSSDVNAFLDRTKKAVFLENNEIAFISLKKPNIEIFNFLSGKKIKIKQKKIFSSNAYIDKQGFKHFMLKEIFEQPLVLRNSLKHLNSRIFFNELNFNDFKKANKIFIVACGTSFHAALLGKQFIELLARIPVEVALASEFRYSKPLVDSKSIVIAVSQSGETADTLAALREAKKRKAKAIAIVNVPTSTIARESDKVLCLNAGPEIGVASTKAFSAQSISLLLLALWLAQNKKTISSKELKNILFELKMLPAKIDKLLDSSESIKRIAFKYSNKKNFLFLGRAFNYPIALEGALKLKEISYIHAEGYAAAEMKHGPIALIDSEMPSIVIAVKDNLYFKTLNAIEEIKARKGLVIVITTENNFEVKEKSNEIIFVPQTIDLLYPFLTVVVLQLFAYFVALKLKRNIDKPRNLAKSVTVE